MSDSLWPPWTAALQASSSLTISGSWLQPMSIESVIPSNRLILCCPLLLPSVLPSIRVFSSESVLRIRRPKDGDSAPASVLPMNNWQWFSGGSDSKASACNAGDLGLIPGLGRSPGEGNGSPLQYSCLENFMDWAAWWATVHGVTNSQTRLSDFTFTFHTVYWYTFWEPQTIVIFKNVFPTRTHLCPLRGVISPTLNVCFPSVLYQGNESGQLCWLKSLFAPDK